MAALACSDVPPDPKRHPNHVSRWLWAYQEDLKILSLNVTIDPKPLNLMNNRTAATVVIRALVQESRKGYRPVISAIHIAERAVGPQSFFEHAAHLGWGTNLFVFRAGSIERVFVLSQAK